MADREIFENPAGELRFANLDEQAVLEAGQQYFSAEALELIGAEAMSDLLEASAAVRASVAQTKAEEAALRPSETSKLQQFLEDSAESKRFKDFIWASTIQCMELRRKEQRNAADWKVLERISAEMYEAYLRHKESFKPLPRQVILTEMTTHENAVSALENLYEKLRELLDQYETTSDEPSRRRLIEQMSEHIINNMPEHSITIPKLLGMYVGVEAVMSKFAQLEAVETDVVRLLLRFTYEGNAPTEGEPMPGPEFHTIEELRRYTEWCEKFNSKNRSLHNELAASLQRYSDTVWPEREAQATVLTLTAANAHHAAMQKLITLPGALPDEIDYTQAPFHMLRRKVPGVDLQTEMNALFLLASDSYLRPVRRELQSFLQQSLAGATPGLQALLNKNWLATIQPHAVELAKAHQTAKTLLVRHLDSVQAEAKMLKTVAHGQKPPVAKKKAPTPAEQSATQLYNTLHREGFSDDHDKSLIVAVATGAWDRLESEWQQAACEYYTAAQFAGLIDSSDVVAGHPLGETLRFSLTAAFAKLPQLLQPNQVRMVKWLSADQRQRLLAALAAAAKN